MPNFLGMTQSLQIAPGQVVTMHYTLNLGTGQVVDSSEGGDPLAYLHGAGNIVPGLEKAMEGKAAGATFQVSVPPEEGYGIRQDDAVQTIPRDVFPPDADLQEGVQFQAMDQDEQPIMGRIDKLEGDKVTVDFNHPLAGETLAFTIEVVDVRAATEEEVAHGHVHGPGGHDH